MFDCANDSRSGGRFERGVFDRGVGAQR